MRAIVFDHADNFLFELSENDVFECVRTDELNGEHSLTVTTTRRLQQSNRVLMCDARGVWREYVVTGPDEAHESGASAIGTYYCVWSVQHDLSVVYGEERRPGVQGTPVTAGVALKAALDGTARWSVAQCDVTTSGGVMMYNNSAWERIADVIEEFGGELESRITVSGTKVVKREVILYRHQGSVDARRRFDWGVDATSIRRTPPEGARVCRVIPVGAGEPRVKAAKDKGSGDKISQSDVDKVESRIETLTREIERLERETIPNDEDTLRAKGRRREEIASMLNPDGSYKYPDDSSTMMKAEAEFAKAQRVRDTHALDLADKKSERTDLQNVLEQLKRDYAAQQAAEEDLQKKLEQQERDDELYGSNRKVTIVDANNGIDYLEDPQAAEAFKLPAGDNLWEYPSCIIENGDISDPAELKEWAQSVLHEYTRPTPTYEASVIQYAEAGMDVRGVALGDVVHIVDSGFNPNVALRVEARVVKIVTNELNAKDVRLTVGALRNGFGDALKRLTGMVEAARGKLDAIFAGSGGAPSTAQYLNYLLDELNKKINATGGYTYLVPGEGLMCYDCEVSDPTVGAEASRVVQLKGGSIRIASSRTASGDWDWQLIMTAEDGLAAEAVTAASITTGFIGSPSGNYWNLDTGELYMGGVATLKDKDGNDIEVDDIVGMAQESQEAVAEAEAKANRAINFVDVEYAQNSSRTVAPAVDSTLWSSDAPEYAKGKYIWTRMKVTNGAGTVTYSDPQMISGADGADGGQGIPGKDGKDGATYYTHIAYADNVTLDSSGKATSAKGFTTSNSIDKPWLGICSTKTQSDPTDFRVYEWQYAKGQNGADGVGIKGADGKSAYLHIAYADSSDGSAYFSTVSAGDRDYVGYCTDDKPNDPALAGDGKDHPDKNLYREPWKRYKWQLTKGLEGASPKTIVEQYVMTASNSSKPASSAAWSENCPQWVDGKYIWTRSKVTWSTGAVTYTSAVLAKALNSANMNAWKALTQEIGATNLLIDSNVETLGKKAATHNRYFSDAGNASLITCELYKDNNLPIAGNVGACARFVMASGVGAKSRGLTFYSGGAVPLANGRKYTVSCMARVGTGDAQIQFSAGTTKYVASAKQDLTREWKRYSWTFQYSDSKTGGSNGTRIYFKACGRSKAARVFLCGFKLENGEVATAWSSNPEDVKKQAKDEAEKYTNKAFENRGLTDAQVKAMKAAITQEGIYKTLCQTNKGNNFATMKDGKYYINATWIQSGVLDAGVIRAGTIASRAAWEYYANQRQKNFGSHTHWNLSTGFFYTNDMYATNMHIEGAFSTGGFRKLMIQNAQIRGYDSQGKECYGSVDFGANSFDIPSKRIYNGLRLQGRSMIELNTACLNVYKNESTSTKLNGSKTIGNIAWSGRLKFYASSQNGSWNGMVEMVFVNGLLVGCFAPKLNKDKGQPNSQWNAKWEGW